MLTFFKFQSILCLLLRIFSFFYALLLWFLWLSPWFLNFTFFFRYAPLFFLFFISFWSFTCFLFLCFVPFLSFAFSVSLMVDYSDIRITSPSVAFFFARLGVFIGFSSGHCPQIGDFTLGDNSLSLVLGDQYPLLCQSLGWFESVRGVLRKENMSSEVRFSDLEANLSSSAGMGGVETDTVVFVPSSSLPSVFASPRSFHALKEECFLREDSFLRFRDRF